MNVNRIKGIVVLLICTAFVLPCLQLNAQTGSNNSGLPSAKVGQMSDQQIMQLWQQAQRSGLSENDAMSLLVKRGLPSTEVNAFKKRLVGLQSGKSKTGGMDLLIKDSTNFLKDSSWMGEVPQVRIKNRNYGFEFFSNPDPSFTPNLRITTPKSYVLGPGDQLNINYTGVNETSVEDLKVSPQGTIQIPYAGAINVNGLTIEQATDKIKNKMLFAYPSLSTGKTQIFLTLTDIKTIRVKVIGEAERPGDFYVSALTSFANVLYRSEGPSEKGSLRRIDLIRNNKVIETVDFYSFLQNGILGQDIRLEDLDIIRYQLYKKRVILAGAIKRPAVYELLDKETLGELIQYGGGLDDGAIKDVAKVVQMGDKEMNVRDVAATDFNYFIPRNGDSVFFEKILPRYSNRVVLTGAVYRPGNYELTDHLSLSSLIKRADGLKEDAFLNRGIITRRKTDYTREQISFNLGEVISGKQADILLMKEDSVIIYSRDNLLDIPTVTVAGNVRMPNTFEFRQGMSLEDVILMAGGFTDDAANHKVELSRLEKNKADTLANKLIDLTTLDIDSSLLNQNSKTLLQPHDYIFVPRLLNYRNLGTVKIRGEVLYAGDYALEKRNETVQEVIKRSGGISPFASMNDVQVFRKGLRVGTTLLTDGTAEQERFLLQPDDSIYIPRNEPFVEVKGAVFNPQILSYEPGSFLSYISKVGGTKDSGNLRKAYIVYSNGISSKIHHFLFFRIYPKVLPGSKIIVPERSGEGRKGISIIELATLTGSLSALVGLISILKN